jgi:sialidase-1
VKNGDDKNRLLFANANSADRRKNLTVRISYDEGQTWSEGKTVYAGGSAYSSMTVLANGDIGRIF